MAAAQKDLAGAKDGDQFARDKLLETGKDLQEGDDVFYDLLTYYVPIAILVLVVGIAIALTAVGWDRAFSAVFDLVENSENQFLQVAVINLLLFIVTVTALPAPAFYMMLNGFFFGFANGWVFNFCTMFCAILTSRWIAHGVLKDRVRAYLSKNPVSHDILRVLESAAGSSAWMPRIGAEVAMATMSILVFVLLVVLGWYEYSQRKAAMEHEEERQPLVRSSDSSASGAA
eukprot:TRINITY_DN2977_c0_g1_i4.p1 TRINITY_DN2977_c0_g1~~TRINITY_DN2977_c0_g1_i4.p1  ORF type:complete len:230 (-),score=45.73 TRINITY_DN2977_c0_g1_i4:109-798(-)